MNRPAMPFRPPFVTARRLFLWVVATACFLPVAPAVGAVGWGRSPDAPTGWSFRALAGGLLDIDGGVKETTRPYYELIGREAEGEDYRLSDMGFDRRMAAAGAELDWRGRLFRLGLGVLYFNPSARAVALRDYYIGIADEIEYEGERYEYMKIPEGDPFTADIDGFMVDLSLELTPFSLRRDGFFELAPWVGLLATGFAGHYDLDAGEPRGTTTYENPPREYVIGGRTSGWSGLGMPAPGLGFELVVGPPGGLRLAGRGGWHFLHYRGDTRHIPFRIRHHKDLKVDFDRFGLELLLEFPISARTELFFGARWQRMEAEAEAKAKERTPEEIEEMREKFDKEIDFKLESITGFIGLRF